MRYFRNLCLVLYQLNPVRDLLSMKHSDSDDTPLLDARKRVWRRTPPMDLAFERFGIRKELIFKLQRKQAIEMERRTEASLQKAPGVVILIDFSTASIKHEL